MSDGQKCWQSPFGLTSFPTAVNMFRGASHASENFPAQKKQRATAENRGPLFLLVGGGSYERPLRIKRPV